MATATLLKRDNVGKALSSALDAGGGLLRLTPTWVPRSFLQAKYRDFDHTHPNSAGHRLIAALACQQAPADWGCDCDAIRHAVWKGKVVAGQ